MKIYFDDDASLEPLAGKTVAILGYGNQGRAQALNLRDSGATVLVGNREDSYAEQAQADGFEPLPIPDAAAAGDFLFILTTDESQPFIWDEQIAPGVAAGNTLVWASGYNVGYDLIQPRPDVDVVLVAPRMTGNMVRTLFTEGKGAMAQAAVHQDASGLAWARMMAIAKGIGATRGGVIESSFREEAELDLFAEQIVWSGLVAWFEECFKLGVEHGFSPELMVLELYASGEASEILGLMARNGFYRQMAHHSTTSQYGTLTRSANLLNDEIRAKMRNSVVNDIKGGAFVKEWSREQAEGSTELEKMRQTALGNPMSEAEKGIISLVQQAHGLG
ncbi:MAG: ketol-acid reductoisomerase [Caldilineaceae bacterium]|nr:ketol-acid reductoisomerase [Caldilineaceae bacterium]MDE0183410.1 ketol-acid reductoisomerase [Caldilineaceae bacterium]